jgi:hypothetical protein
MTVFNVRVEDSDGKYVAIKVLDAESEEAALKAAQKDLDANVAGAGYKAVKTQAKRSK